MRRTYVRGVTLAIVFAIAGCSGSGPAAPSTTTITTPTTTEPPTTTAAAPTTTTAAPSLTREANLAVQRCIDAVPVTFSIMIQLDGDSDENTARLNLCDEAERQVSVDLPGSDLAEAIDGVQTAASKALLSFVLDGEPTLAQLKILDSTIVAMQREYDELVATRS